MAAITRLVMMIFLWMPAWDVTAGLERGQHNKEGEAKLIIHSMLQFHVCQNPLYGKTPLQLSILPELYKTKRRPFS